MRTVNFSSLFIFIVVLTSSCNKTCPAFPELISSYFPYSEGQVLKFANENKDTVKFTVNKFTRTLEKNYVSCTNCECESNLDFAAVSFDSKYNFTISGYGFVVSANSTVSVNFTIAGKKYDVFKQLYNVDPYDAANKSKYTDTLELNEGDVGYFSNVILVREKGIVQFTDKVNKFTWKLVE